MTPKQLFVGTYTQKEDHVDGKGKGIYLFDLVENNGELQLTHQETFDQVGINPTFLAISSTFLYAVNECNTIGNNSGEIRAFKITQEEQKTKLQFLNSHPTRGAFPCHVVLSEHKQKEKVAAVANYGGGSIALFPIDSTTGQLDKCSHLEQLTGASHKVPARQEAPHVHSCTTIGNTLFAMDLGNDKVMQYALQNNMLVPFGKNLQRPGGSGPRHMAIHPNGNFAYVVDELSSTIGVFEKASDNMWGAETIQNISALPEDGSYVGDNLSADIHVSLCGKFLYCSNRGHDSIACYRINAKGRVDVLGFVSTEGQFPRNFIVLEDTVIVANQNSHNIVILKINKDTGMLHSTGKSVTCPSPVCLIIR